MKQNTKEIRKDFLRKKKGITLIALVVTIIVLLILAGVALSLVAGSNGTINRAGQAADETNIKSIAEEVELAMAKMESEYYEKLYTEGSTIGTYAEYARTQLTAGISTGNGTLKLKSGSSTEVEYSGRGGNTATGTFNESTGSIAIAGATTTPGGAGGSGGTEGSGGTGGTGGSGGGTTTGATIDSGTYSAGQEVTFGGEKFFVIADDGNSVRLLAKYCLSKTANEQMTASATKVDYGKRFSYTNYWKDDFTRSPFDLQGEYLRNHPFSSDGYARNNAIIKAQEYGESKNVTGRLMTYAEAKTITSATGTDEQTTKMKSILYGKWTDGTAPTQGYLYWWLGDARNTYDVWIINGSGSLLDDDDYGDVCRGSPSFGCIRVLSLLQGGFLAFCWRVRKRWRKFRGRGFTLKFFFLEIPIPSILRKP